MWSSATVLILSGMRAAAFTQPNFLHGPQRRNTQDNHLCGLSWTSQEALPTEKGLVSPSLAKLNAANAGDATRNHLI